MIILEENWNLDLPKLSSQYDLLLSRTQSFLARSVKTVFSTLYVRTNGVGGWELKAVSLYPNKVIERSERSEKWFWHCYPTENFHGHVGGSG